ncbi:MAG: CDP-glucose 4,6-dehydratase, partial [Verrucomicrobiota bacterium]
PWQHVLDCLSGYLRLAEWISENEASSLSPHRSFNFGPARESERSVGELVGECLSHWPGEWEDQSSGDHLHEANRLAVSVELAQSELGWVPTWTFPEAIAKTMEWYRAFELEGERSQLPTLMRKQISNFESRPKSA